MRTYSRTRLGPTFHTNVTIQAPGDTCWPSDDDWASLNTTRDGRLIQARPPASVCYESEPDYDRAVCNDILSNWQFSTFHLEDPTSIDYPFWADNPCPPIFPNGTSIGGDPYAGAKGCTLGKYPSYVVNATSAEDIGAAMEWASGRSIRLNIKNTGHSHIGRYDNAPGSRAFISGLTLTYADYLACDRSTAYGSLS